MIFKYMYKYFVSLYFYFFYIGVWNYYRYRCSFCIVNFNEVFYFEWGVFKLYSDIVF